MTTRLRAPVDRRHAEGSVTKSEAQQHGKRHSQADDMDAALAELARQTTFSATRGDGRFGRPSSPAVRSPRVLPRIRSREKRSIFHNSGQRTGNPQFGNIGAAFEQPETRSSRRPQSKPTILGISGSRSEASSNHGTPPTASEMPLTRFEDRSPRPPTMSDCEVTKYWTYAQQIAYKSDDTTNGNPRYWTICAKPSPTRPDALQIAKETGID